MQPVIITLTRYSDIFIRLRDSIDQWEPDARKIVITSGGAKIDAKNWEIVSGIEPFIYARNANLGLNMTDQDVLLINDDCKLTQPILKTCQKITQNNPEIGVLSPQIDGGVGNRLQMVYSCDELFYISHKRLAFVCVYIPAKTLQLVGKLDESFTEYGCDDDDYCHRVQKAGLILAVTPKIIVKHGFGENKESSSYLRNMTKNQKNWSTIKMWVSLKLKEYLKK